MEAGKEEIFCNRNWITILIPTFNRREYLRETLNRLEMQTNKRFYVFISDNNSSYPVGEVIDSVDDDLKKRCYLKQRAMNIGASLNYLESLACCKTKWVWMLADDDLVKENAILNIYKALEETDNPAILNFTLAYTMPFVDSKICLNDFQQFVNLYYPSYKWKNSAWHGDLIFNSNKVYNMDVVGDYISFAIKYSYAEFPSVYLILKALEANKNVYYVNERIVDYNDNSPRSWKVCETIQESRILNDIPIDISNKLKRKVLLCISFKINTVYRLYYINRVEGRRKKYFFEKMYYDLYKHILPFYSRAYLKTISILAKTKLGYYIVIFLFWTRFNKNVMKLKRNLHTGLKNKYNEIKGYTQ